MPCCLCKKQTIGGQPDRSLLHWLRVFFFFFFPRSLCSSLLLPVLCVEMLLPLNSAAAFKTPSASLDWCSLGQSCSASSTVALRVDQRRVRSRCCASVLCDVVSFLAGHCAHLLRFVASLVVCPLSALPSERFPCRLVERQSMLEGPPRAEQDWGSWLDSRSASRITSRCFRITTFTAQREETNATSRWRGRGRATLERPLSRRRLLNGPRPADDQPEHIVQRMRRKQRSRRIHATPAVH